jgi:hypothetical protein
VFGSYDEAIDWLHNSTGKYSLINDDYPEYFIPGEYCLFNIETGLFASYPSSGLHIHTLANPNETVGNSLNESALGWHGFTITNAEADLNIGRIGQEPGLAYDSTGHVISIDDLSASAFGENLIFEAILRLDFNTSATVLSLINSTTNSEIFRLDWISSSQRFEAHYPGLGSFIRFEAVTTPWNNHIHLVISSPRTSAQEAFSASQVIVNGTIYAIEDVTGTNFAWSGQAFIQIGNNRGLDKPIVSLKSAKLYAVPAALALPVISEIKNQNFPIFQDRYF